MSHASPIDLCRIALWGFAVVLVTRTRADPDLWGHLRFGLDMIAQRAIHAVDPYSFTSDRPWVNHEWLAEVLMGAAYSVSGPTGLILLKLAVVLTIAAIVWKVAAEYGATPAVRDGFVVLTLFATYSRTQVVRPQMFSVALCCALLYVFRTVDKGSSRALFAVPLIFAAWVNLHGGWIVGLAMLGVWAAAETWRTRDVRRGAALGAVAAASTLATLCNPYGYGLWLFLADTVRPERPGITDWLPLLELPPAVLVLESILPAIAIAAVWKARPASPTLYRDGAVLLLLLVATIRVGRVDAFLQSAIAILLAGPLLTFLGSIKPGLRPAFRRRSLPVTAIGIVLAVHFLLIGTKNLAAIPVEGHWIPDRAAVDLLRQVPRGSRVVTWFDWGEYALWQLSPAGILVSMDGRRETVYSEQMIMDHRRFYLGSADAVDLPTRLGADYVWLPSRFPIVPRLLEAGWLQVADTGQSVVLGRKPIELQAPRSNDNAPAVFPWP